MRIYTINRTDPLIFLPPYSPDLNPHYYPQVVLSKIESMIKLSFRFSYPRHNVIDPGRPSHFLFIKPPNFPNQIIASFILGGLSGSLFVLCSRMYKTLHSSWLKIVVQTSVGLDNATFVVRQVF